MKITFYGAAREVTGSCYFVKIGKSKILVDCGMFQGTKFADAKNFQVFGFDAQSIDAVLITHGHLDHIGRLPKLINEKFSGTVYMTPPTKKITEIVLQDTANIMEKDFKKEHRPKLYEAEDVKKVLSRCRVVGYDKVTKLDGFSFRFRDAGHILGSSFIEVRETGGPTVVFSGDVGNYDVPILRETEQIEECDALITESTYGDRLHENVPERSKIFKNSILNTIKQKGVLLIPAFAVERTQQLLYELNHLVENNFIPNIDVYLDSPMAIKITEVFKKFPHYFDEDALRLIATGDELFDFPNLKITNSTNESKAINDSRKPKIIIAGSGMMNGGRILHHMVRYLPEKTTTLLIIGYQANNTLGGRIYSGTKKIKIFGKTVPVHAKIVAVGGYSAHADQEKLLNWIEQAKTKPKTIYCTHGEKESALTLASRIKEKFNINAEAPIMKQTIEV